MQQIERTRILSEELQKLVEQSMLGQDFSDEEESEIVSETLYEIFLGKDGKHLNENMRPAEDVYLRVLECPPDQRTALIGNAPDEASGRKLQIAHEDLIRLTGCEDYCIAGEADAFDFSWVVPLVRQKESKNGDDTGGVKVQRLQDRQRLLDLCVRIRPVLSSDQANRFLMQFMRDMPIRYRSPLDAIYYFALESGDALEEPRAFIHKMLDLMARYYLSAEEALNAEKNRLNALSAEEKQRLKEEKAALKEREKQRLREEKDALKQQEKQAAAELTRKLKEGRAAYENGTIRRAEWYALQEDIERQQLALKQAKQQRRVDKQNHEQRAAQERARMRMVETFTISQQFSDVEPGDCKEFVLRYTEELPQMDLLDNHYAARRHLRENLEAVGAISEQLVEGRRKTAENNELYLVRLTGAQIASANIVTDMLIPEWYSIGRDFLSRCGGILPETFPDRELLRGRFESNLFEEAQLRGAPSPETLRMEIQTDPDFYGPFFYRALRKYSRKSDLADDLRRRIDMLTAAQKRFCQLMEDDNIFQFIASDYDYECIVGSNKAKWPVEDPSRNKSSRLEKIAAKASRTFALNRNDVADVPRSLLLLTELARIDCRIQTDPVIHINATLIRCGYPGLYARRRLDQFVLAALGFMKAHRSEDASSESIVSGLHEFLRLWLMEPVNRLNRKLKAEKYVRIRDAEIREKPQRT